MQMDLGLVQADEPQGTDQQTENLYDEEARSLERLRAEVDNLIQAIIREYFARKIHANVRT